jgi:sulfur relay protein TusB/DsrH
MRNKMHIGFILTKTPSEEGFNTFLKLLKIYIENDKVSIYLLGNGVYCFIEGYSNSKRLIDILKDSKALKVYANIDDMRARGLTGNKLINCVEPFETYDELVKDIMENIDQVLSF